MSHGRVSWDSDGLEELALVGGRSGRCSGCLETSSKVSGVLRRGGRSKAYLKWIRKARACGFGFSSALGSCCSKTSSVRLSAGCELTSRCANGRAFNIVDEDNAPKKPNAGKQGCDSGAAQSVSTGP